jgi:hypothetical protein
MTLSRFRPLGTRGEGILGHFGITENGAENVVEVMGNATGQGADGLHFLGLDKLGLQAFSFFLALLTLADVMVDAADPQGSAIGIALNDAAFVQHPDPMTRFVAEAVLCFVMGCGTPQVGGEGGCHPRKIFRMDLLLPGMDVGFDFLAAVAQ